MTQIDPSRRPSADLALQQWQTIRGRINILRRFGRLRQRDESLLSIPLLDILYTLGSVPLFSRLLYKRLRRIFVRIYS